MQSVCYLKSSRCLEKRKVEEPISNGIIHQTEKPMDGAHILVTAEEKEARSRLVQKEWDIDLRGRNVNRSSRSLKY